ncbi:MAG: membrane-binding protein [Proteobacteria bacterium]|nr:MAG: membrane-binding protein [Pseudomonadota bacterium]
MMLLAFSSAAMAQTRADYEPCSYYGESLGSEVKMYPASEHAKKVINGIIATLGLKPNFEIREANVPNAAAVVLDSKRYILYNAGFMDDINDASGTYWAGISILAHEIGHHLNGHTLDATGSRPNTELEADEFSGFVLNKMGASLEEAQAAMAISASLQGSHTHPARAQRLSAIALGWKNASGQGKSAPRQNASRPALARRDNRAPATDPSNIAFNVYFSADEQHDYYITKNGELVSVDDGVTYFVGSLSESNKRGYKLMLSDKNFNYLYIASGGSIVNGAGKKVGKIEPR